MQIVVDYYEIWEINCSLRCEMMWALKLMTSNLLRERLSNEKKVRSMQKDQNSCSKLYTVHAAKKTSAASNKLAF